MVKLNKTLQIKMLKHKVGLLSRQLAEAERREDRLREVIKRIKKGIARWKEHGEDYSLLPVVVSAISEMADKALEAAEAGDEG